MTDALPGLVAALLWALIATVHAGLGVASAIVTFGMASLALVPSTYALRRARPFGPGLYWALAGAGLSSFPLAIVGSILFEKTHHRALGGVTFAFISAVAAACALLVARRVQGVQVSPTARSRFVLFVTAALSVVATFWWIASSIARVPAGTGWPMVEGCTGLLVLAAAAWVPALRRTPPVLWASLAGLVVAVVGLALAIWNRELVRHLADAAPVTTFVARSFLL
jgi:hypothetical protein